MIHKSSIISNKAIIGKEVKIGPFCYIGENVVLSDGVELISNIHIEGIKNIDKIDIDNANKLGYKIKLLGVSELI